MTIPDIRKYSAPDGRWWLAIVTMQPRENDYNGKPCTHWEVRNSDIHSVTYGYRYGVAGWLAGFESAKKAVERRAGCKVKGVRT